MRQASRCPSPGRWLVLAPVTTLYPTDPSYWPNVRYKPPLSYLCGIIRTGWLSEETKPWAKMREGYIVIQSRDFSLLRESIMMRWPCATNCPERASGYRETRVTLSLQAACSCDHQGGLMNYTSRAQMGQASKNQLRKCTERPISGFTMRQPIC